MRVKNRRVAPLKKKRKKKPDHSLRSIGGYVLVAILACILAYAGDLAYRWLKKPTTLPFNQLKVVTNHNFLDLETIQATVRDNLQGGFFSLDMPRLEAALKKQVWIKSFGVRRVFPSTLVVSVIEYTPVAYWGQRRVLTANGMLILPGQSIALDIPKLSGPDEDADEVLQQYIAFSRILKPLNLSIHELVLTPRQAWSMQLSNGLKLMLGRENLIQRLGRFVAFYPRIKTKKNTAMVWVDLRYPNGFAIKWAPSADKVRQITVRAASV